MRVSVCLKHALVSLASIPQHFSAPLMKRPSTSSTAGVARASSVRGTSHMAATRFFTARMVADGGRPSSFSSRPETSRPWCVGKKRGVNDYWSWIHWKTRNKMGRGSQDTDDLHTMSSTRRSVELISLTLILICLSTSKYPSAASEDETTFSCGTRPPCKIKRWCDEGHVAN